MFENLLPLLQKKYADEKTALTTVKKWFTDRKIKPEAIKQLNDSSTLGNDILLAAANNQSAKVLSFLLKQGFDPCVAKAPFGFNVLHEVTLCDLAPMAEVILQECPQIIDTQSREGATALFLAIQQKHPRLVDLLLKKGASPNQSDIHGLTPFGAALLKKDDELMMLLSQHPQCSPLLFEDLSHQTALLTSMINNPLNNTVRCMNLLLAAGEGLELTHIPDKIFELFGTSRDKKDFLILAQEKQTDGSLKKRLITTFEQLTKYLGDPNWKIDVDSLARTCQHPLLQHLPKVQNVKALLQSEAKLILPTLPIAPTIMMASVDEIQALSMSELVEQIRNEMAVLSNCLRSIQSVMSMQQISSRLLPLAHCVMQSTHAITALWHHPKMSSAASYSLFEQFNLFIQMLMSIIHNNVTFDSLSLYLIIDKHLKTILKHHGDLLKKHHTSLFNSLVDARALFLGKMSRLYLQRGEFDVAINASLEAININELLVLNHPILAMTAKYNKALSLVNCSQVYISQGWISKAARHTAHALELLTDSFQYDELVINQVQQFAARFAQSHKTERALALIKQAIAYLERVLPSNDEQEHAANNYIDQLNQQHATLLANAFMERSTLVKQQLQASCDIVIDESDHSVYLSPTVGIFSQPNQEPYFDFLENNKGFQQSHRSQLRLSKETLLSKAFPVKLAAFADILAPKPVASSEEHLGHQLAHLQLEEKEETFGFKKPEGFTRIVPIESSSLPKNTLFITMPENSEAFAPFYKLIRNQDKTAYYSVASIAAKGLNQYGVKLGTASIKGTGHASSQIAYGRLKVEGTLRAKGLVEQTVEGQNGKQCKLYVFRHVENKKQEQRKKYQW